MGEPNAMEEVVPIPHNRDNVDESESIHKLLHDHDCYNIHVLKYCLPALMYMFLKDIMFTRLLINVVNKFTFVNKIMFFSLLQSTVISCQ